MYFSKLTEKINGWKAITLSIIIIVLITIDLIFNFNLFDKSKSIFENHIVQGLLILFMSIVKKDIKDFKNKIYKN